MTKYIKPFENLIKMNINLNLKNKKSSNFKKCLDKYNKNTNKDNNKNLRDKSLKNKIKETEFIYFMKKYFKK